MESINWDILVFAVTVIALFFAIYAFSSSSALSKKLTPPAVELIEIKHILKKNKKGYESFAVFKNNTQEKIELCYSGNLSGKGIPHVINIRELGTNVISFLYGEENTILNPGSLKNVKIADMSSDFIESQEFHRLNLNINTMEFSSRDKGIEVHFNYFHNNEKLVIATLYPYEYDMSKLKLTNYFNYKNQRNQDINSVFLVLNKEYDKLRNKYSTYLKYTKNSVEKYVSLKEKSDSWAYSSLLEINTLFKEEKDMHEIFFGDSEREISENIMKHIDAIVIDYDGMTYVKSYITRAYSVKYVKNKTAKFFNWRKLEKLEKNIYEYKKNKLKDEKLVKTKDIKEVNNKKARLKKIRTMIPL